MGKLYIYIYIYKNQNYKIRIIYCPHKFTTGTPISATQAQVVADFAVPALNMILIKCLVKSISHQKKNTHTQTEFATTNEKLYENCKIVKLYEKKDGATD